MTSSQAPQKHWNQGNRPLEWKWENLPSNNERRGNHLMCPRWLMSRRLAVHVSRMFDFHMTRPKKLGGCERRRAGGHFWKARRACLFWKPKGTLIDGNAKKQTASCLLVIFPQRLDGERSLELRSRRLGGRCPRNLSCTENVMDAKPSLSYWRHTFLFKLRGKCRFFLLVSWAIHFLVNLQNLN